MNEPVLFHSLDQLIQVGVSNVVFSKADLPDLGELAQVFAEEAEVSDVLVAQLQVEGWHLLVIVVAPMTFRFLFR